MIEMLQAWYQKHFSNPQVVILALFLIIGAAVILVWGNLLAPILASLVIAYVLEGMVKHLCRFGMPRLVAVIISFMVFITSVALMLFGLVPLVSKQLSQFVQEFPQILNKVQQLIMAIPEKYPVFPESQIKEMLSSFNAELVSVGQKIVSLSLGSVVNVFTLLVFMVVVPLLVFFLLKDKDQILNWFRRFLPNDSDLSSQVWGDVDSKMAKYIRGKMLEIVIVGVATFIPLAAMGMNYAATLSLFVGLSVIIPYVGAVAVTIPVAMIAWFQWGAGPDFVYVMIAYLVVQFLDGNVLVPLLYSEVVNMHPA
ncbi:MAG: AI-2E family transporter, partial [Gammaproteobacteria bacterium]